MALSRLPGRLLASGIAAIGQIGDLLGDQSDQEDDHGRAEQQRAHVCEPVHGGVGVAVVAKAGEEEGDGDGGKEFERGKESGDLEDDQQKAHAVLQRLDVAGGADSLLHVDGHVGYGVGAAEERHGGGGGVGESVGQKVQELAELLGAGGAEAGGEIQDAVAGHVAGQPVVEAVGQATVEIGLTGAVAGADDHVVAFFEFGQQLGDVRRLVLAVGIHENEHFAGGGAGAAFYGCAVAHGIGRGDHPRAVFFGHLCGLVGGAIVDHDNFGIGEQRAKRRQGLAQAGGFVLGGQDDAECRLSHRVFGGISGCRHRLSPVPPHSGQMPADRPTHRATGRQPLPAPTSGIGEQLRCGNQPCAAWLG